MEMFEAEYKEYLLYSGLKHVPWIFLIFADNQMEMK